MPRPSTKPARRRRTPVLPEPLEGRMLFAVDYLLSGNQLTVTTNGTAASPVTVPATYTITGDAGVNHVTVQNWAGALTVDGRGGGDLVNVYAGGGGTVVVHDAAATPATPTQLVVRAPASVRADVSVTPYNPSVSTAPGTVTVGSDAVSYDGTAGSVSLIGQLFTGGDNLTVNGTAATEQTTVAGASLTLGNGPQLYYATFNALTVNGNGGDDTFTVNNTTVPTTLVAAAAGAAVFTVNSNTAPLTLVGPNAGSDTVLVNANSGPLVVTGGAAPVSVTVGASSGQATVNGGAAANVVTVNGNSALLTVNANGTSNNVTVAGNAGTVNVVGTAGTDAYTVGSTTGGVALHGGAGPTAYNVPVPTLAPVTITGGTGAGVLAFGGTPLADSFNLTANTVSAGTGATVTYSGLTGLTVAGGTGADLYLVNGDATPTTLVGGSGSDVYNVLADTARVTVNSGTGPSAINVGSNAPSHANDALAPVAGGVTVNGNGADVLNLLDGGDAYGHLVAISPAGVTGFNGLLPNPFLYANLATVNLALGAAADLVNVAGTAAGTTTNLSLGAGANQATVAPAGVAGTLNLTGGGGGDALAIDDSATAVPQAATVAPTAVTGFGPAPVNYAGMASLTVRLGTAGTALTVAQTNAATTTIVNGGPGPDAIRLLATASTVAVTPGGHGVVTVGSVAHTTAPVAGTLIVSGTGTDTLAFDDAGDLLPDAATVDGTYVTGLTPTHVTYAGLRQLDVAVGTAANAVTVNGTAAGTTTNLAGGPSADTFAVRGTAGPTNLTVGTGTDTVTVGTTLAAVAGPLSVVGNGATALVFDDTADAAAATGTLTASTLTGLTAAPVTYAAVSTVDVRLGTGTAALAVRSTGPATRVRAGSAPTTVTVGSAAPAAGGTLADVNGPLAVTGNGQTALSLDDSADVLARTVTLTATAVTGPSPAPVTFAGLTALSLATGGGADAVDVQATAVPTTLLAGPGPDAITVGNAGLANAIVAPLSVDGHGTATLTIDDHATADAASPVVTAAAVTGVTPAAVTYANLAGLTVSTGTGDDTYDVQGTSAPTTINPGPGTNTLRAGSAVNAPLTVNGSAADSLTLSDTTAALARSLTVTPTAVTGLAPAPVYYAGIGRLDLPLGTAGDTVAVVGTGAATAVTIRAAATGTNAVTVGSPAHLLTAVAGPLTVVGNGSDLVTIDDAAAAATTVAVTSAAVTGASPAPVRYASLGQLTLDLGPAGNAVDVRDTGAPTVLNAGTGTNAVHVAAVTAPLTLVGSGRDALTADVSTAGGSLSPTALTLNAGTAAYAGMSTVAVTVAPSGHFTVTDTTTPTTVYANTAASAVVQQTHAPVTLADAATGPAAFTVGTAGSVAGLAAPVTVRGGGADTLLIDDTADASAATATVTPTAVTGLGTAGIAYAGLSTLTVAGGSDTTLAVDDTAATAAQSLTVTGTSVTGLSPATIAYGSVAQVTLALGTGPAAVTVVPTALTAPVSVAGNGGNDTLRVDASADAVARSVTATADTLAGFAQPVRYARMYSVDLRLGTAADALAVVDPITPITADGGGGANALSLTAAAYAGTVAATRFQTATAAVTGDFAGSLTTDGTLSSLTIGGNDTGTVSAAAIGSASLPHATPAADGTVLSLTQAGAKRSVRAIPATGVAPAGLTFAVAYDGSTAHPSAAVTVTDSNPAANRFDLVLDAPTSAPFDLARLASPGGPSGVRNVTVAGDLLTAPTAAESAALSLPAGTPGGVRLPTDAVAAVAVAGHMPASSVAVATAQAIAFHTVTDQHGKTWTAAGKPIPYAALISPSVVDPKTRKATDRLARPTEPLRAVVGTNGPVTMYVGYAPQRFDPATITYADQANDGAPVYATATFAADARLKRTVVQTLAFDGNGGSVDTLQVVDNLTSTGPLGDVSLRAGKAERLASLTAPSMFGKLKLFGGTRALGSRRPQ